MTTYENPIVALYPPPAVRRSLRPEIWQACVAEWCALASYFLANPAGLAAAKNMVKFLRSYVEDEDEDEDGDPQLRRSVYLLLFRQYSASPSVANVALFWAFVRKYARGNRRALAALVSRLPEESLPTLLVSRIRSGTFSVSDLHALKSLARDKTIASNWTKLMIAELRSVALTAEPPAGAAPTSAEIALKVACTLLLSSDNQTLVSAVRDLLSKLPPPSVVRPGELLPALVMRTPFLKHIHAIPDPPDQVAGLAISLDTLKSKLSPEFVAQIQACFRKHKRDKKEKNIKLVKEIFPHLSDKYVATLLDAKMSLDRVLEYLVTVDTNHESDNTPVTKTETDEDSVFDNLEFPPNSVYFGKRDTELAPTTAADKEKIFDSLRLFYDEDDDERDDTYDDLDSAPRFFEDPEFEDKPESERSSTHKQMESIKPKKETRAKEDPTERYLWGIFASDSSAFDTSHRKTAFRSELKTKTGWTDEQLEGWAKVLSRDARHRKRLEAMYSFAGNKPILSPSSQAQDSAAEEEEEDDDEAKSDNNATQQDNSSRQRAAVPGRASGGKAAGRKTGDEKPDGTGQRSGKAPARGGAKGRGRGRGSGANHNRKDQRGYKLRQGMAAI